MSSKWTRHPKTESAVRADRLIISLSEKGWVATRGEAAHPLLADSLGAAVVEADISFLPKGWEYAERIWSRPGWDVILEDDGWGIYRGAEKASVRAFETADKARFWVELRLDRTSTNLRGPKPRAGSRSTSKLPDVRVTQGEREEAGAITKSLGMTYSEFARASLAFAREHVMGGEYEVREREGELRFVPRDMDL
jgi:hypothetical protein